MQRMIALLMVGNRRRDFVASNINLGKKSQKAMQAGRSFFAPLAILLQHAKAEKPFPSDMCSRTEKAGEMQQFQDAGI
ncbi:MAG TPA: hypothetical protein VGE06_10540 [Flavisolibacter sp.]